MKKLMACILNKTNRNASVRNSNAKHDIDSTDESESDFSIPKSVSNDNEGVAFGPSLPSNIGIVRIKTSNDINIGNKIVYERPVIIQQPILYKNRPDLQASVNNVYQSANVLSQPVSVFTAKTAESLRIVDRDEWFARPSARELEPLKQPAIRVIIAYTAGSFATTHGECAEIVRNCQAYHIDIKGWDDISYNFLVGGDGSIYVGRGWDFKGEHSQIYNRRSICIAFSGTFTMYPPSERSLIAAQQLIQRGVELQKIAADYRLYGHRQLIPTISPGNKIYEIIQTWDHWTEQVISP